MNDVIVIGGGLAGMASALRLAERGCNVSLYESDNRLGGKAGSIHVDKKHYSDHGYHLFPAFYLNTWALIDQLGIRGNFTADLGYRNRYFVPQKKRGGLPLMPLLFFYSLIDLMSRSDAELEPLSVDAFFKDKFYHTERLMLRYENIVFKALSNPTHKMSALTVRNMVQLWLRHIDPPKIEGETRKHADRLAATASAKNSLQEMFIHPFQRAIEGAKGEVYLRHALRKIEVDEASGRVTTLHVEDLDSHALLTLDTSDKNVIFALPPHAWPPLLKDVPRSAHTEALFGIAGLRTAPMMALDVHLKRKLPRDHMPREHLVLIGSRFHTTLLDLSELWVRGDGTPHFENSVIQTVSADTTSLHHLSHEDIRSELIHELLQFGIFNADDVDLEKTVFHPNFDSPLFMNDVGTHHLRMSARSGLPNGFFAGDWCHSQVDVSSMESAVTTGLLAAEEVRQTLKLGAPIPLAEVKLRPRLLWQLVRVLAVPFAWIATVLVKRQGLASRTDAEQVLPPRLFSP